MGSEPLSRRGLLRGTAGAVAAAAFLESWPARAFATAPVPPASPARLSAKEFDQLVTRVSAPTDPVAHLLHRTTFGVPPGELDRARRMGIEAWLDEQLHPERIDDSAVDAALAAQYPTLSQTA